MDRDSYSLSDDVNQSASAQPNSDSSHLGQPSDNGAASMSSTSPDPASSREAPEQSSNKRPHHQTPNTKPSNAQSQPPVENFWVELRNIVILSGLLTLGIRWFVVEARYIPTESMLPTLEVNDRLIVEKVSYRFREPKRGDVVVFRPTEGILKRDPAFRDALIKRIVGMPGETVEVRSDGTVYINNESIDIPENTVELEPSQDLDEVSEEVLEEEPWVFFNDEPLIETYATSGDDEKPFSAPEAWGPVIIPEDSYLVLGDNRRNSYDSRYWEFVRRENLIGRAAVRFWPLDRFGALNEQPLYYSE